MDARRRPRWNRLLIDMFFRINEILMRHIEQEI
jgi:hypothetical protein